MALESFYGGKPGFSPVIKAKFKYINNEDPAYIAALNSNSDISKDTMDECFKDPEYTDVWYGELCIIDTDNKMNPNNGKLYRRTLKKNNDDRWTSAGNTTYAEYIGQIVGPSGGIPKLDLGGLTAERLKAVGEAPTINTDPDRFEDISNWEYAYPGLNGKISTATPSSYNAIQILEAGGIEGSNIEMVPGKDEDEFNDTIKYTWCNVRRTSDNSNVNAWFYLGFQIPYTVFDVDVIEENFTYGQNLENEKSFIDNSDPTHPFYKNYEFHIPRGVRGVGLEQVFVINPQDNVPDSLYEFDAIQYDQENDVYSINEQKKLNPKPTGSYWVGLWRLYNPKTTTITSVYQYLGSYKDIRGVELANDGSLIFTYSDGNQISFNKKIKWIDSINIDTTKTNSTYGQIKINYNNGSSYSKTLPLIKSLLVNDETGKINIQYADRTNEDIIGTINAIKQTWIDPRGHLLILYTSSEYRPTTGEGNIPDGGIYYQQSANPNNKYSQPQTWVKGTLTNKIAETDSTNWWHDLGEVYKISVPKITTSYNGENKTVNEIIADLNELYANGNIGETKGGLIAVENIEIDEDTLETRIFYYDEVAETWADLGTFGSFGGSGSSSSNGSIFYVEGYNTSYNGTDMGASVSDENKHITYPLENAINPEFYFTSSQKILPTNSGTYAPNGTIDSYTVLGNGIHLFDYIPT